MAQTEGKRNWAIACWFDQLGKLGKGKEHGDIGKHVTSLCQMHWWANKAHDFDNQVWNSSQFTFSIFNSRMDHFPFLKQAPLLASATAMRGSTWSAVTFRRVVHVKVTST